MQTPIYCKKMPRFVLLTNSHIRVHIPNCTQQYGVYPPSFNDVQPIWNVLLIIPVLIDPYISSSSRMRQWITICIRKNLGTMKYILSEIPRRVIVNFWGTVGPCLVGRCLQTCLQQGKIQCKWIQCTLACYKSLHNNVSFLNNQNVARTANLSCHVHSVSWSSSGGQLFLEDL